ncbi:MAG: Bug family tripartite tricarboxylate transporter substrate binding protein [Xanthobacteraceae bacterium]
MTGRRMLAGAALLALLMPGAPLQAESVADFYRGQTVTIIVSSSAGGGYDTVARTIARFLGKHIPGNPPVVVRNMPGAGGMSATNYLYNQADKNGAVIGLLQNNTPFEPLFGTKEARYDPRKLSWLGTPSFETAMLLLWHTAPVDSVTQLRTREIAVGVSGANSTPAFYARLLNATLGTRMRLINGYAGQTEVFLAMERREVDGHPSAFYNSVRAMRPAWLRDHLVKPIVQYGPEKIPELGDVPFALDLVESREDRQLIEAAVAPLAVGRPFVAPPGVAGERIAALRAAFAFTMNEPEFLAEAERLGLGLNAARTGAELQELVERAYSSPPGVIERLRQLNSLAIP